MLLSIVGMPGSGKSEAARFYVERGFHRVYFGGIVLAEVNRRGMEQSPANEKTVREDLRKIHGMEAMARLALPEIRAHLNLNQSILIDGLYSMSEYRFLREEFGDGLVVIAVVTPRSVRYGRLATRPVRPLTADEALRRDYDEIDRIEKAGPIAMADYFIMNDSTREALFSRLAELSLHG